MEEEIPPLIRSIIHHTEEPKPIDLNLDIEVVEFRIKWRDTECHS